MVLLTLKQRLSQGGCTAGEQNIGGHLGILPSMHMGALGEGNIRARKNYMHRPISVQESKTAPHS